MKRLFCVLVSVICTSVFCFGQLTVTQPIPITGPIQTGFGVVTPIQGTGAGLSVVETFGEVINGNLFQTSVLPSPLVTTTAVFFNVDRASLTNTGIAIVNPDGGLATVTLSLRNGVGATLSARTLTLGQHQQISQFVTDLFPGVAELNGALNGLVFISSNVPIAVLGLAFNGPSFTALPVATQLVGASTTTTTLRTGGVIATGGSTFNFASTPSAFTSTVVAPVTTSPVSAFTPNLTPPLPSTITPIPPTIAGLATTPAITAITMPLTPVSTQVTAPVAASISGGAAAFGVPQIATGIGGIGSFLLPQIATGGGWVTQIVIANTSNTAQFVRVDFFNPSGGVLTLPSVGSGQNVLVPAGGVVVLSTI